LPSPKENHIDLENKGSNCAAMGFQKVAATYEDETDTKAVDFLGNFTIQ
jgi:hypothetical protein